MRTDRHWLHQKLVAFARAHGLKAAARQFGCSRNTARKWLRRHVPGKPSSLSELSRRPKHCPHHAAVRALGANHRSIPPKRYTWQSDVDTVHRLVEDEFFDRETFTGPADFWRKVTTYWL